jgi:hypothetical protein
MRTLDEVKRKIGQQKLTNNHVPTVVIPFLILTSFLGLTMVQQSRIPIRLAGDTTPKSSLSIASQIRRPVTPPIPYSLHATLPER